MSARLTSPAHRPVLAMVFAVVVMLASACGGTTDDTPALDRDPLVSDTSGDQLGSADAASREVDDATTPLVLAGGLDAEGVVAAALLIASGGDLEAAISAGLVTEAEANAAIEALDSGTLTDLLVD